MGKSAEIISRLIIIAIVLWGLLGLPQETTSAAGTVVALSGINAAFTCQSTPISIRVENVENLTAYHLEIDFTPGDVVVTKVENGGFLTPGLLEPTNGYDNTAGTVVFGMARQDSTTQPVDGSGVLINIWVKAINESKAVNFTIRPYVPGTEPTNGTGSALVGWPDAMPIPYTITNGTVYTYSCPSTDIQLSNTQIDENLPVGTTIGTFTTIDPDPDAVFTYSLTDTGNFPDNAYFTIAGSLLKSSAVFNYEVDNSYTIRVRSESDGGGIEETFTITITDANDPPVLGAIGPQSVNEHALLTFTASATDQDLLPEPDTLTFSLAAIPPGTVPGGASIGGSSGIFSWTPAEAQGPGSYTFNVCVSDGAASDCEPITVTVYEINAAPSGADKTVTILEDGSTIFGTSDFGFTDGDIPANTLSGVIITTLPTEGSLKLNGTVLTTPGTLVPAADITGGKLTYEPLPNGYHTPYASFTFQVKDNGGIDRDGVDTDPTPNNFTINVTSVSDAPAGADKTVTILEDQTYTFDKADFGFLDTNDTPANNFIEVVITTLPTQGTLKLGTGNVSAGQSILVSDIDLDKLAFTPAANGNGNPYASFTFQVKDDGSVANGGVNLDPTANTITFVVTAVNDAPVGVGDHYYVNNTMDIDLDGNTENGRDAARLIIPAPGVMSNDYDVDGDTLTVSLKTYTGPGLLTLNPNGSFTYTSQIYATNYLDSFVYTLSDGHGGTVDVTVNLTIDRLGPPGDMNWVTPITGKDGSIIAYDDPLLLKFSTTSLTDVVKVQFRWWDTRVLSWVIVYDQPPVPGKLEYSYTLDMKTLPYLPDVQVYAYVLDASGSYFRVRVIVDHQARVFLPLIKR